MQIKDHGRRSRRELLRVVATTGVAGIAAGILAGCGLLDEPDPPPPHPLAGFLTETERLVAAYDGFLAAQPTSATKLQPLRDAHAAHVTAIRTLINLPSAAPTTLAAPSPPATLAALKALEKAAAGSAYDTCLTVVPASHATLLGEIAAARSTHLVVLS
jgi:hypothetical protein